jgi:hypothetical protein
VRVLVACEFSGRVRDSFIRLGHDAISCDLLESERPGPHVQGDVRELLKQEWDLIIAFPPLHLSRPLWYSMAQERGGAMGKDARGN